MMRREISLSTMKYFVLSAVLSSFVLYEVLCQKPPATFILDTPNKSNDPATYHFKNDLPLMFIIHGWTENANKSHYVNMAQFFLKSMDCYVVRVDYSELAGQNYVASVNSVREVGRYVGDFLINITKYYDVPMSNVHVIGHSLGGQVSGFVGKRVTAVTGKKVQRITALDPAGPLFENNAESSRLCKKDAELVDVIHTDGGVLGCDAPLGHVDFYPNGGTRWQPGCYPSGGNPISDFYNAMTNYFYCSHHKSYHYFTASIMNDFKATKCDSWDDFHDGKCEQNQQILFGARMPSNASGSYFLAMDVNDEYAEQVLLALN